MSMESKDKILIFTRSFLPGYKSGGPITTIDNFCSVMSRFSKIRLVTKDRDDNDPGSYPTIKSDRWSVRDQLSIFYIFQNSIWSINHHHLHFPSYHLNHISNMVTHDHLAMYDLSSMGLYRMNLILIALLYCIGFLSSR